MNRPGTGSTGSESALRAASSTLSPNITRSRPANQSEEASTASIKSGVIGFPQGAHDEHAALGSRNSIERSLGGNQTASGQDAPPVSGEHKEMPSAGSETSIPASTPVKHVSAGEASVPEDNSYNAPKEPASKTVTQAPTAADTERSFPLTGGVAYRRTQEKTTTSEREPGTKEKEAGVHDGQGREALAGAAAAAAASSTLRPSRREEQEEERRVVETESSYHPGAVAAAAASSSPQPFQRETENEEVHGPGAETNPHPAALAAATTAAAEAQPVRPIHEAYDHHHGHDHTFRGDPCASETKSPSDGQQSGGLLFTSGPHKTDTANRLDPHLHIPGEFPSPTPVEEPSAPSYLESKQTTSSPMRTEHELRHTGTLNEPRRRSADRSERSSAEHHYGRDAAIAGGLGAAGLGAYEVGKHHQKEPTDMDGETLLAETNPYSSSKLDPRVDVNRTGFEEQKYDPAVSEGHQDRKPSRVISPTGLDEIQDSKVRGGKPMEPQQPALAQKDENSQHLTGRDAALVGAGAATTAGLYASQRANEPDSGPASSTIGPHQSNIANILDPRVQPDPTFQKHHWAAPTVEDPAPSTVGPHKSDLANIMDPRVLPEPEKQKAPPPEEHHYGHDAAMVGGTAAADADAYEVAKAYGDHRGTQPGATMAEQRYDPSAAGAHDPYSTAKQPVKYSNQQPEHHYGRDAALVGGAGAAGAGAYAATHDKGSAQQPAGEQSYPPTETSQLQPPNQSYQPPTTTTHQRYDSVQDPKHNQKRDVAAAGATGAVVGVGAYEFSQQDAQNAQKMHEQQLKEQQREFDKKQKEQEKAFHEQQKEIEKRQAKEQKHHNKLVAAEDKKHQKEIEKEQKQHEKEEEVEKKDEKKHRLFGFLHRDKKDKEGESSDEHSPRQSKDSLRHSKEYAGAGAAAGYSSSHESDSDGKKGRNRLHKDPPPGHPAREAMEHAQAMDQAQVERNPHMGIDGPIGDPNQISGDQ